MNEENKYRLKMLGIALVLTAIVVGILEYARAHVPARKPAAAAHTDAPGYVRVRLGNPEATP